MVTIRKHPSSKKFFIEKSFIETWYNRQQMTSRDSWDIILSTFNDDIFVTLNQLVAILRTKIILWWRLTGNSRSIV